MKETAYRLAGQYLDGAGFFTAPTRTREQAAVELGRNAALRECGTWRPVKFEHAERVEFTMGHQGKIEISRVLEVIER